MTLTIFRAGNSNVIAIPKELRAKYGLEEGAKAEIKDTGEGIAIIPLNTKPTVTPEFNKWLVTFEKKYDKALRELAKL